MHRFEGEALKRQLSPDAGVSSRQTLAVEIAFIVLMDLAMVLGWTAWWHLSDMSGDNSLHHLLGQTVGFLTWTFLPCWGVALVLIGFSFPVIQRRARRNPAFVRACLTVLAPALWALVFCWYYEQLDYAPTAALIAEAAWIVTLQPLWAYLAMYRLRAERG